MKMRSVAPMRVAKIGYIVVSVAFCVIGMLMIAMPDASIAVFGNVLGIAMAVFGVIKLVGYFSKDLYRLAFQYDLQFGILLMLLGIIILLHPDSVLNLICISFGVCMIADGLFKVQIAMESRAFGIKSWWLILSLAVLTCVAGLLVVFRPSESVRIITVLLGVSLLSEGILNLSVAVSMVKIIKHQMPDVIEGDCYDIDDSTDKY